MSFLPLPSTSGASTISITGLGVLGSRNGNGTRTNDANGLGSSSTLSKPALTGLKNATYYTLLEAAMELESWELVAEVVAMLLIENEIWKLDDI